MTEKAIKISTDFRINRSPYLIILNDEDNENGTVFLRQLKSFFPDILCQVLTPGSSRHKITTKDNTFVIFAIFSETKAWKGSSAKWLIKKIVHFRNKADLLISFGNPYLFDTISKDDNITKIISYWDSDSAQIAVAKILADKKIIY